MIEVEDLGIEFYRSRRRKLSLREMVLKGQNTAPRRPSGPSDVTFTVGHGEAVGLVGSNGSGKSTLLKTIAGVLIPDEGSARSTGESPPSSSSPAASSVS